MAATAHSDPYAIFMRKIGYSVGLEYTAERVASLVSRYTAEKDITTASWNQLVTGNKDKGNWGRDKNSEKHIADFFNSLKLIQLTRGDILALENLDAMTIIRVLLEKETEQILAQNFLLLWAILVNDGEIFVNLLLSDFKEQKIKKTLTGMILQKREKLAKCLPGKAHAQHINKTITIEYQEKNRGSSGFGNSIASLKRTTPLTFAQARKTTTAQDSIIAFSNDYFRKVPPRRKDWAVALDLWRHEEGMTTRGQDFINELQEAGYIDRHGYFIFWPMEHELVRSGFRPNLLGDNTKDIWTSLIDFGKAYAGLTVKPYNKNDTNLAFDTIFSMMNIFKNHHVRKSMLRRELPITITYPAIVAIACAKGKPVLNLPAAISAEQKSEHRRIALRHSRNTGGALSIKR